MSGRSRAFELHGQAVVALYAGGKTMAQIAAEFGVSPDQVRYWLKKMGVKKRHAREYDLHDTELFWSHVVRNESPEECWAWSGTIRDGYGRTYYRGRSESASRVSWLIHQGPIPDGLFVLHSCDNRPCTNPKHLFLGTNDDNMADMGRKGRNGRKLTMEQAVQIKARLRAGQLQTEIAKEFGVTKSCIQAISSGRLWQYAP